MTDTEPGICRKHGLPGISHTYASAWASYQKYNSFLYLVECFQECRRLKWPLPEPLLAEMEKHFAGVMSADNGKDARLALGVGTSQDGGEVQFPSAIHQADADNMLGLFEDLQVLGITKRKDQFRMIAGFTGRTANAIKTKFHRITKK